jgi:hypothetical protein
LNNTNTGQFSTVIGGRLNKADHNYDFAAGRRSKATHDGVFIWGDSQDADYTDNGADSFNIRAQGGAFIAGALTVSGGIGGSGGSLTGIPESGVTSLLTDLSQRMTTNDARVFTLTSGSVSNLVVGTNSAPQTTNVFEAYRTNGDIAFSISDTSGVATAYFGLTANALTVNGTGPTTIFGSAGLTNYIAVSTLGTLISNVFGVVFNNKGIYISNNAAALAVAYDATSGSLSSAGSNFLNLLVITNFATVSNQLTVAAQPDFRQVSPLFTTNASFTWATPNGFDATGNDINYTTITVTNNSGSAITMTGPANYNLVGTNSINAGGVNEVRFKRNAGVISNWYSLQDR